MPSGPIYPKPFEILWLVFISVLEVYLLYANSVGPDQKLHYAASDRGLQTVCQNTFSGMLGINGLLCQVISVIYCRIRDLFFLKCFMKEKNEYIISNVLNVY